MSRLVDADDLKKRLWEKSKAQHPIPLVEHDFRELIEEAPTVDAEEIVWCKNCKYVELHKDNNVIFCEINELSGRWIKADDYCSYGERKEQEHE